MVHQAKTIKSNWYVHIGYFDYQTILIVYKRPVGSTLPWISDPKHKYYVGRGDKFLHPKIRNVGIYTSGDKKRYEKLRKITKGRMWIRWSSFPKFAKA